MLNIRRILKQHFIVCLLSVILLLTMGMDFETDINNYNDFKPNPSVENDIIVHRADYTKLSLLESFPSKSNAGFNLNVRSKAYGSSDIISEVNRGILFESLNTTENVWLTPKNEGDVNGKYAKLVSKNHEQSAPNKDIGKAPNKPSSTVKSDSGLIKAQIEEIFKGTSLGAQGLEKAVLEIEEEFGINAYFTIAVMKLESANGKSRIARNKNNLFGLNAIDGDEYNQALSFETKGDSVRKFGQLISKNYVNKGYTTIEKISKKYCLANPKWPGLVKEIMEIDYKKL